MASARNPWDRADGETQTSFSRFRSYLSMAPPRSRAEAAELLGVKRRTVDTAMDRGRWVERAAAYDDAMAKAADRAAMSTAEDMQRRHMEAVHAMLRRGVHAITEADLTEARDGVPMIDKAVRLERLLVGEATERTESRISSLDRDPDLSRLTDDERAEWLALEDDPKMLRWLELDDKARGRGRESL